MKLHDYYWSLTAEQQESFAEAAGTSREYCRVHLIPRERRPDRTPGESRMRGLADASSGSVSLAEVLDHFYQHKARVA